MPMRVEALIFVVFSPRARTNFVHRRDCPCVRNPIHFEWRV
jgi:hypothetical protein